MTNTLLRLQKKVPEHIVDILRNVSEASANLDTKAFVIGAIARDLVFEYVYGADIKRKTEDVDFGIAIGSWAEYESLKVALIESGKFRDDPSQDQRIWWTGGTDEMRVDLVPYGGLESHDGEIEYPPTGDFVMSTLGFREASENLLALQLTENFAAEIVSLPGLVLLKFVAYNDSREERRRDVQDIWFIAQNYMKAGNEDRLYEEDSSDGDLLNESNFDYRTVGARLLGRDIVPLLNEESQKMISKTLAEQTDGGGMQRFADVIYSYGLNDENRYEKILTTLRELRRGIHEQKRS